MVRCRTWCRLRSLTFALRFFSFKLSHATWAIGWSMGKVGDTRNQKDAEIESVKCQIVKVYLIVSDSLMPSVSSQKYPQAIETQTLVAWLKQLNASWIDQLDLRWNHQTCLHFAHISGQSFRNHLRGLDAQPGEWRNADATLNPPCSFPHRHCWMAIPKIAWPNLDVLQFSNTSTRNRPCVWPWSGESCAHFTHQLWNQMNWVQIMGRSCAEHVDMYKTQCIRSATTNRLHGSKFCNYKVQSTTWFEQNYIENNSRYALQKAMHLKLKIAEHRKF